MSFDVVYDTFKRTRLHVKQQLTVSAYQFVTERLKRACELFQTWLDVYELLAGGYQQEVLTWSKPYVIQSLSMAGSTLEETLIDIFQAKIPAEIYILLQSIFRELNHSSDFYVVAEGECFEQKSIYGEMYNHSLKNLHVPRPIKESEELAQLLGSMKEKNTALLYYERGQYDNALSWPLLIHECLHWLYVSEGLGSVEKKLSDKPRWIEEVLIDMFITNLLGPAYAVSLASYLYRYPHEETLSHPHFIVRLYTCSKYLNDLAQSKGLPPPMDKEIYDALDYIKQVQDRHEDIVKEIQEQVNKIYDKTRDAVIRKISRKTKTFTSFIQNVERERERISHISSKAYPKKQVFSIKDVQRYCDLGIPIAAHPKVLFNSFISKEWVTKGVNTLFVKESLKKWFVRGTWEESSQI